ncbi:MAG: hypothetical protein K8R58_02335 [Bacteroidales bacterium]|nr:hypothetical protein [Bacteroidales bacterium]
MLNKLQELTEKIYSEGVSKANQESDQIIAKTKKDAEDIINNAKKEKKSIIDRAEKQAAEIKKNVESEVQLSARQAISAIKQQITNLVTTAIVEAPVKQAFNDTDFIKKIILTIIHNWNPQKPEAFDIALLLPQKDEKELNFFFENKAKKILNAGLEISFDQKIKKGFKIGPKDGSYIISFTDEDFENYFKNYLRPRTTQLLYQKK